jgi:prepilin-type N-terminal cleavage/methylation domain-containing protein
MNQRGFTLVEFLIVATMVLILAVGIGGAFYRNNYDRHEQIMHVQKAERVVSTGGQDSKYLIFADEGTYENTDSLLNGKFNSSDVYGQLKEGHTYKCLVYGWRSHYFSHYPNILHCGEVK